jgi:mannose-1-phosphate guanylyltransferase
MRKRTGEYAWNSGKLMFTTEKTVEITSLVGLSTVSKQKVISQQCSKPDYLQLLSSATCW